MTKLCGKCSEVLPVSSFGTTKRTKDGLQTWCKGCAKRYREANKEKIKAKKAEWCAKNSKRLAERQRSYYEANKAVRAAYSAEYVLKNKEKVSAYKRQWVQSNKLRLAKQRADHYRANAEDIKARVREYSVRNRAAVAARGREYRLRNKGRINAYVRERYRSCPAAKTAELTRSILKRVLRATKQKKVYGTFEMLGYQPEALKHRIEAQFKPGMSWDNHGEWHIDHKIPIAHFIAKGETRPWVINALCNLQPLWAEDNWRKYITHHKEFRQCG